MNHYLERHAVHGRALVPGCGRGHVVALAVERGLDATGLDITPMGVAGFSWNQHNRGQRIMNGHY